jgi:hypothetical protein
VSELTTIGYATLQIIPSLKGVSDAIEKQIEGKVVEVAIAPRVDQRATDQAGKQAREGVEKHTREVTVEPKVDQRAAEQAGRKTRETVEKHTKSVTVEPKVNDASARKAGKTVGDRISGAIVPAVEGAISGADLGGAISKKMEATWGSVGSELGTKVVKPVFDELLEPALKDVAGKITTAASTKAVDLLGAAWQKTAEKIKDAGRKINSAVRRDDAPSSSSGGGQAAQAPASAGKAKAGPSAAVKNAGVGVGNAFAPIVAGALDSALAELDLGPKIAAKLGPVGPVAEKMFDTLTASVAEFAANQTKALASVAVEGLATAWNSVAASTLRAKVASAAAAVAQGAQMAATKAAAAAQWLWNAALTANPIGLVVTAIAAVVAGLVLFFTKTELGRKIWAGFTEYLKVAWEAIKTAFSAAWEAISKIWDGMVTKAGQVWEGIKSKFTAVVDFVKGLPSAISSAASGMWDGISNAFKSMVDRMKGWWNDFASALSFTTPDWLPGDPVTFSLPKFDLGGYTGNVPADRIAGVVHGDEFVVRADSRRRIENALPGLLDYLNNNGKLPLPGYQGGGRVQLGNISGPGITTGEQQSMWDAVRSKFPDAILSSATRTVQTEGHPDYHNAGRAIDISGPGMGAIASWIASTFPDSLELIHSPFGHNIKNGKNVGDGVGFYGGGLMAAHANHVHWALGHAAKVSQPNPADAAPAASAESDSAAGASSSSGMLSALGVGTTGTSVDSSSGSSTNLSAPGSLSGIGTWAGQQAGTQIGGAVKNSMGGQLPKQAETAVGGLGDLGSAAGQFVDGQVGSALEAFGINGSPGWLKGLSTIVGGISIGGGGGASSVAPVASAVNSATPAAASAIGSVHGGGGGKPGPTFNTTITAGDTEQAFVRWQRWQNERASANLGRY